MSYKMVTDIGKLCGSLAGSAIQHRDLITADLTEMWRRWLEDGQIPDLYQIQTFVARDLREIHAQLAADAKQVQADLTETHKGRVLRDGALVTTRERLFAVRKVLDAVFGPGGADAVFMKPDSQVGVDPVTVFDQAMMVAGNLTDPEFDLPAVRLEIGVDLKALAESLREPAVQLGEALDELQLTNPRTHASLEAKGRSFGKLSRRAILGARLLEAIYAYSGHEGIAARTRPTSHRAKREAEAARAAEAAAAGATESAPTPESPPGAPAPRDGRRTSPVPGASPAARPSRRIRHIPPEVTERASSPYPLPADLAATASSADPSADDTSAADAPASDATPRRHRPKPCRRRRPPPDPVSLS